MMKVFFKVSKSIIVLMTIIVQIVTLFSVSSAATMVTDQNDTYFSISGQVDLKYMNNGSSSQSKAGFKIQASGTNLFTLTDENGHYDLSVPVTQSVYSIKVSKPGYLEREITPYIINKDTKEFEKVSINQESIIDIEHLWAGDIAVDGKQDNIINMLDVIELSKSFNLKVDDPKYSGDADLNSDNVINMNDVILIAKNFNRSSNDYIDIKATAESIENAINNYISETNDYYLRYIGAFSVDTLINRMKSKCYFNDTTYGLISYGPYLNENESYYDEFMKIGSSWIIGLRIEVSSIDRHAEVYGSTSAASTLTIY